MQEIKPYANRIYSFDIETSTDRSVNASFMNEYSISTALFSELITSDLKADVIQKYSYGRTWSDFIRDVNAIIEHHKELNERPIIFVHNLSFEWSFMLTNIGGNMLAWGLDIENSIFIIKSKPYQLRFDDFEIRCSFALVGMSIKKVGEIIGIPKLGYDYDEYITPSDVRTQDDIDYVFRDTELQLRAIALKCLCYENIKTIDDLPLTSTGFTRKMNEYVSLTDDGKKLYNNGVRKHLRDYNTKGKKYQLDVATATNQYIASHPDFGIAMIGAYNGGYVAANARFKSKIQSDVESDDYSSDYPSQMASRYYPISEPFEITSKVAAQAIDEIKTKTVVDITSVPCVMYNSNRFKDKGFIFDLTLCNVKFKDNLNPFLCLSETISAPKQGVIKYGASVHGLVTENGKVLETNLYHVACTEVTLIDILQNYDCDIFVNKAWIYSMGINEYWQNLVKYYGTQKQALKTYGKKKIITDELNSFYRLILTKDDHNFDMLYRNSKADLNAQYGINVQKIFNDTLVSYIDENNDVRLKNPESYIFGNNTDNDKQRFSDAMCGRSGKATQTTRCYLHGLYITAYARSEIHCLYQLCNENNIEIYYTDTDSVKRETCDGFDLVALHTQLIESRVACMNDNADYILHILGIGYLDNECTYKQFVTVGSKRYVSEFYEPDDNGFNVHATISGLPHASDFFQSAYEKNSHNFRKTVEHLLHRNTIFNDCKLASNYSHMYEQYTATDGSTHKSGVILEQCNVSIYGDTTKGEINESLDNSVFVCYHYFRNDLNLITGVKFNE